MVDPDDRAVGPAPDAVTALAVGIVHQHVEHGELAEAVGVLLEQREVVLLGIVVDEPLHHPDADRPVAQHGRGHEPPAQRVGQLVRRDLALAQRAAREVPQRTLAPTRLVDGLHLDTVGARHGQQGGVRRPRHAAEHLELAVRQDFAGVGVAQFQRGHRCPAGSIGMSHSGHSGRPAATASAPLAAIARTCPRVA